MSSQALETRTKLPAEFSPLQRILLTANGNVQRILSAYYNDTVQVRVIWNEARESSPNLNVFDRKVEIVCDEKVRHMKVTFIQNQQSRFVV